jgi:hypothetical protein
MYVRRRPMQTKLTLRLDGDLIRKAKRYSRKSGKSMSRLVADYFAVIEGKAETGEIEITPRVQSLLGALAGADLSEKEHRRHLEAKHR